jgi:hypothetical protein
MELQAEEFYRQSRNQIVIDLRPQALLQSKTLLEARPFDSAIPEKNKPVFLITGEENIPKALTGSPCIFLLGKGYESLLEWQDWYFSKVNLFILGGKTGTGKTAVLKQLHQIGEPVIDLEELAAHKGSVFGNLEGNLQPRGHQFRHHIFDLLYQVGNDVFFWIEEEGPFLGELAIPSSLYKNMLQSQMIELILPFEQRLHRLMNEYGSADVPVFIAAIRKLEKRMGTSQNHRAIHFYEKGEKEKAFQILLEFYDRMYEFRRDKYRTGNKEEFRIDAGSPEQIALVLQTDLKKKRP